MRRRSKADGKPAKTRRRETAQKRRSAPKVTRHSGSSATNRETRAAQLTRERDEALQRQTAAADVLRIISRSTFDLQTVLNTLVESASRHCDAYDSIIFLHQGGRLHVKAHHGPLRLDFSDWPIGRGWITGRAFTDRTAVHVHDPAAFAKEFPDGSEMARRLGYRTILAVPLLRDKEAIGAITIRRSEVKPFTDKEIELVETFADQAVIAIENTRLLNELRQRTADLSEALEQQTATSEVLRVISSSPGELESVFATILRNATHICEAKFATLFRFDGEKFYPAAGIGRPAALVDAHNRRGAFKGVPGTVLHTVWETRKVIETEDDAAAAEPGHHVIFGGARSTIGVPMLKDNTLIGVIVIYRQEVRPFTKKQADLVANFAAQAVIAIENTRLLNELRKSLQQQTATSEVLRVIASSTGDLQPVFETLLANATKLCEASYGAMWLWEGGGLRTAALHGALPPAYLEQWRAGTVIRSSPNIAAHPGLRAITTRRPVQVDDLREDSAYLNGNPLPVAAVEIAGIRTLVAVPMFKDNEPVGNITIYRREVRPFSAKQIELAETFADQAVIAIENMRLLEELQQRTRELSESLEQQTATSEVLRVISSSPGELEPVFQTMLENAVRICDAKFGILFRYESEAYDPVALFGLPSALEEFLRQQGGSFHPLPEPLDRIRQTKTLSPTADYAAEPAPGRVVTLGGARSTIDVPMLKDNVLVGVISIYRQEVRPFTDKQIELVQNFAAQAVIAIENTRLLNELRESLEQQTATAKVLRIISSSSR